MKMTKLWTLRSSSTFAALLLVFSTISSSNAFQTSQVVPQRRKLLFVGWNHRTSLHDDADPAASKIRLNKVFKATHSRRQADRLIASGRVTVNNRPVTEKGGIMVEPFVDVVHLDGTLVEGWESLNAIPPPDANKNSSKPTKASERPQTAVFEYIKYWKPRGVTCTTDRRIEGNIIDEIASDGYSPQHRVYPVGRLDKDTSGLILLTNDGRLPNASLRHNRRRAKVYNVLVDKPLRQEDIEHLRNGVVITTIAQRDRTVKPLTAPTLPCQVVQKEPHGVQMTLYEGRNRQIRKMMQALGYEVVKLHRVAFGDIRIMPLTGPGSWKRLDKNEMEIIHKMLEPSSEAETRQRDSR